MAEIIDRYGQKIIVQVETSGSVVLAFSRIGDNYRVFASPEEIDALIEALIEMRNRSWPWPPFVVTESDR